MAIRKKVEDKDGNIIGYISAPSLDSLMNMSDADIRNNIEPIDTTTATTATADKPQMPALRSLGGSGFGEGQLGEGGKRFVAGSLGALSSATFGIPEKIPGIKQTFEMAKEDNPISYATGEVAGLFTPGGLPSLTSKGITKITGKVLPKLGKVATSAITTGLEGAVQGGIETFVKTGKINDTFKSAMTGAVLGSGAGAGMEAMAPVLKKISDRTLKKMLKGDEFVDLKKSYGNLVDDLSDGKFGTNVRQVEEKLNNQAKDINEKFNSLLSDITEENAPGTFNDIVDEVFSKLGSNEYPIPKTKIEKAKEIINEFREANIGTDILTGENIKELKRQMNLSTDLFGKKGTMIGPDENFEKNIYKILYNEINDKLGTVSPEARKLATKSKEAINLVSDMRDVINHDKAAANIHPIHLMIMFGSALSMSPAKAPGFLISGAQVSKGLGRTMPGIVSTKQLGEKLGSQASQMDVGKLLGHLSGRAF